MNLKGCFKHKRNIFFRLFLGLLVLFISTPIYSCDTKDMINTHSNLLKNLNLPKNSLLSIVQNDVSIITDKETKSNNISTGPNKFKVFQNTSNQRVLKRIIEADFSLTNVKLLNLSQLSYVKETIVSKDGVFIFIDKLRPIDMPYCYTEIFYPKNNSKIYYDSFSHITKYEGLTKNLIISQLFSPNYTFDKLKNTIIVNLNEYENHNDLAQKIYRARQLNKFAKKLIIKPQTKGLQISEINIPITAYDRTLGFKDPNELFYTSAFEKSKSPNLIKSATIYNIDLGLKKDEAFLKVGSKTNITDNLNSNIELEYVGSNLIISKLQFGLKKFNNPHLLSTSQVGRFSKENNGILLTTYKLNELDENLMNARIYFDLNSNCHNCIQNGISFGYEKYSRNFDGYLKANLAIQNYSKKSETTLEFLLRKQLREKNQFRLSAQYNLTNKSSSISTKITFPLGTIRSRSLGSISYSYRENELISNWSQDISKALLDNTPSFLKRNWKNYINFN